MTKKMKKQPRDSLGRFLSHDGTRNRKFSLDDMKKAYVRGLNESGGFLTISRKIERFVDSLGEL